VSRRGATTLAGILLVDKPAGMTSHDVVAIVRRATGEGRVGHAGTLDPMATGLLVVLVGPYARLEPYLSGATKAYDARIDFGSETDTDDAEGAVTRTGPVPQTLRDPAFAQSTLSGTLGAAMQMPPAYSAIKVGGRVAHRAARAGEEIELAARPIEVLEATLTALDPVAPSWDVAYTVSKGTYIRALARDLGRACGSAAHLGALRRTASGSLRLADANTLEEIATAATEGRLTDLYADPIIALGMPVLETDAATLANGRSLPLDATAAFGAAPFVAVTTGGRLVGIYRTAADRLAPAVVFATGEAA
jgi:tRNA pseudouridine55 synthase